MLTKKQHELLMFIHRRLQESGVSPSFDEMKDELDLASKSGIHRLITALEERGFVKRMEHRARAIEVIKLPNSNVTTFTPKAALSTFMDRAANDTREIPLMGKIAAGSPITALEVERGHLHVSESLLGPGTHFALEVEGESMINAGIFNGDYVVIRKTEDAANGEIVVALINREEATLKRLRRKGASIALEAANPAFETRIYGPDQVVVQGKLVALIRRYH